MTSGMTSRKLKRKGSDEADSVAKKKLTTQNSAADINNVDVIKRLRNIKHPVRLFGETDEERLDRLKALEADADFSSTAAGASAQNDFRKLWQKTSAGLAVDQLYNRSNGDYSSVNKLNSGAISTNPYASIPTEELSPELLEKDLERAKQLIAAFCKKTLWDWEADVSTQPEDFKRSTQGKLAAVSQKQSSEAFKYLFRQLKKNLVPYDVLMRLTEICERTQKREYLAANDSYLRLSIGNAPWPIGVTMVGIHERSAR